MGTCFSISKEEFLMVKEVKRKDYKKIADCIISDQVPSDEVVWYFNDKKFYKWYTKHYREPLE